MVRRVGRRVRPVDENAPYADLARDLLNLRLQHDLTVRQLEKRANQSKTVLSDATDGWHLPTLVATLAFVRGCVGKLTETQEAEWRQKWANARDRGKGNRA